MIEEDDQLRGELMAEINELMVGTINLGVVVSSLE
jgi:hypothetical protein